MAQFHAWDSTHTSYSVSHAIICKGTSLIFALASASLLAQYDGLFGEDGIEPVHVALHKHHASDAINILHFAPQLGLDVDTLAILSCLICFIAGSLGTVGMVPGPTCMLVISWGVYLSLFKVGQSFLSFQWDLLLLEVGFLAMLYSWAGGEDRMVLWALRFCLFKLMFMSGVVKIQANCPSWLKLTALEYHYATQCVPTPLAWYAHQLPPFVHQLSVAACLVIEIVVPFGLLAPLRCVRIAAALAQVALQVLILLTGNYNFFNALTILLCFSCFDDRFLRRGHLIVPVSYEKFPAEGFEAQGLLKAFDRVCSFLEGTVTKVLLWGCLLVATLAAACWWMFEVERDARVPEWIDQFRLKYALSVEETSYLVDLVLPWALLVMTIGVGLVCLHTLTTAVLQWIASPCNFGRLFVMLRIALVSLCLAVYMTSSSVTFISVSSRLRGKLPGFAMETYRHVQPLHITTAYGLFRRMTGMGRDERDEFGRSVTVAARPEIIVEVSDDQGKTWHEVSFAYKPGRVDRTPPIVAPHQPRLDWQMWFAALGPYQRAPWFVHLLYKILEGSPDVLALLDDDNPLLQSEKPKVVRARRFKYDFTRWPVSWNRRKLPADLNSSHWWMITSEAEEFTPPIDLSNPSLLKFLGEFEWTPVDRKALALRRNCSTWEEQVYFTGVSNVHFCRVVSGLREMRLRFRHFASVLAALVVVKLSSVWLFRR